MMALWRIMWHDWTCRERSREFNDKGDLICVKCKRVTIKDADWDVMP